MSRTTKRIPERTPTRAVRAKKTTAKPSKLPALGFWSHYGCLRGKLDAEAMKQKIYAARRNRGAAP